MGTQFLQSIWLGYIPLWCSWLQQSLEIEGCNFRYQKNKKGKNPTWVSRTRTEKLRKNWRTETETWEVTKSSGFLNGANSKKVSSVQVDYTWKRSFQGPPSLPSFLLTPGSISKTVVVSFRPYWGSLVWNYMCSCSYCGNLPWWPIFLRLELWLAHVLQMILNLGQICTPPTCRSVTSNILLISSHIKQTASTKH